MTNASSLGSAIRGSPSNKRQLLIGVGLVLGFALLLAVVKAVQIWYAITFGQFSPPPSAVTTAVVQELPWEDIISATGTLRAAQGVELSVEQAGRVAKIHFESGDDVAAGKVLVELDTAVEEAQLAESQARFARAKSSWERAQQLRTRNAVSQEFFDQAQWEFRQAEAQVASLNSQVERKRVVAPFAGRTGIRRVNIGQFVSGGEAVVPLFSADSLYVDFSVPQGKSGAVASGQTVRFETDALPGNVFQAVVSTVNPQLDEQTRTVAVRATLPNAGGKLRPGMFVDVSLVLPSQPKYLTIPASSVTFAPYGNMVYVVEPGAAEAPRSVRQQVVQVGPRRGDQVAIVSGLKAGEEVVSSGGFKLMPGGAVIVNNALAPSGEAAPQPEDR